MEHRWGERAAVDVDVQLHCGPVATRRCRMSDASVSGAFISTALDLRLWAAVIVIFEDPARHGRNSYRAEACVVRKTADGVGIEWNELSPPGIAALLSGPSAAVPLSPGIEGSDSPATARGQRGLTARALRSRASSVP